jgi:cell division protein FtsQ
LRPPNRELVKQERRKKRVTRTPRRSVGGLTALGRVMIILAPIMIVTLLIAAFFTPLFAVKQIVVSGTERLDSARLSASLEELIDKPLTMITNDEVTNLLAGYELIETFALQAEPPSTLRVKVRERQPLMILTLSGQNFMFDAAGVRIAPATAADDYPLFRFQGNPQQDPRFKHAVELLLSLPLETYNSISAITVSDQLTSQLTLRDRGINVFWGSNSEPLLKAEVLDSLLATSGDKLTGVDVSSPNAPVVSFD